MTPESMGSQYPAAMQGNSVDFWEIVWMFSHMEMQAGMPRHAALQGIKLRPSDFRRSDITSSQTEQRSGPECFRMGTNTELRRKSFITRERSSMTFRVAHRIMKGLNNVIRWIIVDTDTGYRYVGYPRYP